MSYFNDYQITHQYDAEQCLRYILEICYPDIHNAASDNEFDSRFNEQFIFRVTMNESFECEQEKGGCGNVTDKLECHQILKLRVKEISDFEQTVENLVNSVNYQDSVLGINCETCNKVNTRTKQSIVSGLKDVLAIQLLIFTHDEFGRERKFSPDLVIN